MKLSIITINYNNLVGLKKTVDSVLSQTWRDFEWIIVDGGSTDGSKEYIETLAQSLSEGTAIDRVQWNVERFSLPGFTAEDLKNQKSESTSNQSSNHLSSIDNRQSLIAHRQSPIANPPQRLLWCSEPDKGVYNAMNKGIVMAQGEYLNFMNSGDSFNRGDALKEVFARTLSADVMYCDCVLVDEQSRLVKKQPETMSLKYLIQDAICHQSAFIEASMFHNVVYDESYSIVADWERFLQWFLEEKCYVHINAELIDYDITGISKTQKLSMLQERNCVIKQKICNNPDRFLKELEQAYVRNNYLEEYLDDMKKNAITGLLLKVVHGISLFWK